MTFGNVTHTMLLQIPDVGFVKAPVAVDGQQGPGGLSLCGVKIHGVFGMGAKKRMLTSNSFVGTSLLGRALCLP